MESTNTKLYFISGFLGAGKTTILTRLLQGIPDKKIAVIQNEFGKLSIDGPIVKKNNIEVVELNRGSIFCSCLQLNFVNALAELALMKPDYIFVESSGLGDPSNVQSLVGAANLLCDNQLELYGLLGLADGRNFLKDKEDAEMIDRQIKHCNMAIITKVDLIDQKTLEEVRDIISEINPNCLICESAMGDFDMGFVGENLTQYTNAENEDSVNMVENKPKTISLQCEEAIKKEEFLVFLETVLPDCYRIKGFFRFADEGFCQVDVVSDRIDIVPTEERDLSQLVFISKIGPAVIKKVFDSWNNHVNGEMKLKN